MQFYIGKKVRFIARYKSENWALKTVSNSNLIRTGKVSTTRCE